MGVDIQPISGGDGELTPNIAIYLWTKKNTFCNIWLRPSDNDIGIVMVSYAGTVQR